MPSIRSLKIIVGVLGVVLAIGFVALAYGVAQRVGQPTPARPAAAAWETLRLREPPGTQVRATLQSGSLVVLHLYTGNSGADERLVVIDAASGRVVGRVAVTEPR